MRGLANGYPASCVQSGHQCWPDLLHQALNFEVKGRIFREALKIDCLAVASLSSWFGAGRSSKLEAFPWDEIARSELAFWDNELANAMGSLLASSPLWEVRARW